jgi:hypothetical protein
MRAGVGGGQRGLWRAAIWLEIDHLGVYIKYMDALTPNTPPDWLLDSLARSDAQIAAGETVPLEPVLDRLRASIARMRAKPAPKPVREA